jgi:hypothetical protein
MTRQLFFAITLFSIGVLLNSPSMAASPLQCEERNANCLGRCTDPTGGAGDWRGHQNRCLFYCDRRVIACLIRAR